MCPAKIPFKRDVSYYYGYNDGIKDSIEIMIDYIRTMGLDTKDSEFYTFLINQMDITVEELERIREDDKRKATL